MAFVTLNSANGYLAIVLSCANVWRIKGKVFWPKIEHVAVFLYVLVWQISIIAQILQPSTHQLTLSLHFLISRDCNGTVKYFVFMSLLFLCFVSLHIWLLNVVVFDWTLRSNLPPSLLSCFYCRKKFAFFPVSPHMERDFLMTLVVLRKRARSAVGMSAYSTWEKGQNV